MRCNICGSYTHEATTAGCPGADRYVPQNEVMEQFTSPDARTSEQLMLELLTDIRNDLHKIRKILENEMPSVL